ncbi:hypothetical protein ALI22I_13580 [Saccharothrix sp. ALI-22-I]|nr:hypothetical protein ALI22I_13580 [Saccharothrix sp. ALI-22-I]
MITATLRRIGTTVAMTAVIAALVVMGRPAAEARPVDSIAIADQGPGISSLHRSWACDVPAGYTYSTVRINTRCAWRYEYYLLDAVNYDLTGTYACWIPSGYTYTASRLWSNCSTNGSSYEYRLAKL